MERQLTSLRQVSLKKLSSIVRDLSYLFHFFVPEVPQPLSHIPVSMLNTGKLTELKTVPDRLLQSLLVSRIDEKKKDSDEALNALTTGGLYLVGISFNAGAGKRERQGQARYHKGVRFHNYILELKMSKPFLSLLPGDTVELVGVKTVQESGHESIYLYGR